MNRRAKRQHIVNYCSRPIEPSRLSIDPCEFVQDIELYWLRGDLAGC